MSKRYAFWRDPSGKPARDSENKFAPREILAQIGKSATVSSDGRITWKGLGVTRLEATVRECGLILDPDGNELNSHDAWGILHAALNHTLKLSNGNQPVNPNQLMVQADQKAAEYFRLPQRRFALITTVSIKTFPKRYIHIRGCKISPVKAKSRLPSPNLLTRAENIRQHISNTQYQYINISTDARSEFDAASKALDAINLLRGIWNFLATYGSWSINFGMRFSKPLGLIHLGPLHHLYDEHNKLSDVRWYEPDYISDAELFEPKHGWSNIEKQRRWAITCLRFSPYKYDLENLFIQYSTALDQPNLDLAFLYMWSILEKITDTVGGKYDETIQRATWIFSDRSTAREHLEALRSRRNQLVHSAKTSNERDQVAYLIKSFIDPHLAHLLRNLFSVEALKDYAAHLALPTDQQALKSKYDKIKRVMTIQKRWNKSLPK